MRIYFCHFLLLLSAFFTVNAQSSSHFPRPAALEPAVGFWVQVYSKISTSQGYIHDDRNLSIIYKTLDFKEGINRKDREKRVKAEKKKLAAALANLGKGKTQQLTTRERLVKKAWPQSTPASTFKKAASRIRFQLGQADRFKEGLIRAGQWKPYIENVFASHGLPKELTLLPHVESSFNPEAYSKAAAAGMWQFMPATARQYMRVDELIDERLDPFIATEGAAKLLKRNYTITNTWPLALTAYNHGAGGMVRATKAVGSSNIETIIARYRGSSFGFASRNFYPSFLAAMDVDNNAAQYFGPLKTQQPINFDRVVLPAYVPLPALIAATNISLDQFKQYNSSFREALWRGEKYLPKGYEVRIPKEQLKGQLKQIVANMPSHQLFSYQKPDVLHHVRPGESLSTIASRYNTNTKKLMALNGLRNANRIRAGQALKLPGNTQINTQGPNQVAAVSSKTSKKNRYKVQLGDTLWAISQRFQVSQRELIAWNNIANSHSIRPGQLLTIDRQSKTHYVIRAGDSLSAIASRFKLSQQDLLRWNKLKDADHIRRGQSLKLAL